MSEEATRKCIRCGVWRPIGMFYVEMERRRAQREGRRAWVTHCRVCQQQVNTERRKPRQDYSDAIKLDRGCADCGIRSPHPEIYDFDHVGEKSASVSTLMTKGTWEQFVAEIEKCEVVCANCHRIRTRRRPAATFGSTRRDSESVEGLW
jgi:hypothetical protein